ncbi:acyltransferase family protein [Roseateles sp. L2-2]|uniref:acyltransferase family protein n=1 Tax=Roseateles sp. L2-2 TaxID=3422597 RepID=UPI003D35D3D1
MSPSTRIASLDYLRIAAASAVMISHAYVLTGSPGHDIVMQATGQMDLAALAVDFFFFLSGFLMFGALSRSPDRLRFARNRLARILPGLAVCVLLCIVLGAVVTTLPLSRYLSSGETWRFLKNGVFLFTPSLPGVFETVPYPRVVNGSLWTLFYEIACYAVVGGVASMRAVWRVRLFEAIALACALYLAVDPSTGPNALSNATRLMLFFALGHVFGAPSGAWRALIVVAIAGGAAALLGHAGWSKLSWHLAAALICVACLVIARGVDAYVRGLPADYSFGIYIYGFPVQQWLAERQWVGDPGTFFVCSMILVLPLAALSWHFVERPAMAWVQRRSSRSTQRDRYAAIG